uniref:HDC03496 n=1 Tax=Drosophila melanogaster TaxID=7227 RepID=Q6IH31_DROME|nr:TPA_inf: HDC03496 [Drosophila melanogaster]
MCSHAISNWNGHHRSWSHRSSGAIWPFSRGAMEPKHCSRLERGTYTTSTISQLTLSGLKSTVKGKLQTPKQHPQTYPYCLRRILLASYLATPAAGIANGGRATKLQSEASRTPRRRFWSAQLHSTACREGQDEKKVGRAGPQKKWPTVTDFYGVGSLKLTRNIEAGPSTRYNGTGAQSRQQRDNPTEDKKRERAVSVCLRVWWWAPSRWRCLHTAQLYEYNEHESGSGSELHHEL